MSPAHPPSITKMNMLPMHGTCDPRFEPVVDLLAAHIGAGKEIGASLYVNIDGQDVIDVWGGWRDRERTAAWTEDTLVNVFSGSKSVTSLAVLMLVDRGQLNLYEPVATYWPAFAQNGKERIEVRHLLSHTAGLPGWEPPFSFKDALDIEASTARLAAQAPWWEPGTFGSYHASSFGHLNAELVRRASGKTLRDFIASEIAAPLQADFHLGVTDADFGRLATVYPVKEENRPALARTFEGMSFAQTISAKTRAGSFAGTMCDPLTAFNSPAWRRAEFGGSTGHANARGLGRIASIISLNGAARGVKLLSPETTEMIFREQSNGIDAYYGKPIRWGIGYALGSEQSNSKGPLPFIRSGKKTCFWYGNGGSFAISDAERRITIAYAMNQCQSGKDSLNGLYYQAIHECL